MSFFDPDSKLMQALEILFYLAVLGLLWLLLSMTVIGIGPASTALYYATVKSVRRGRGSTFREFFAALKLNWLNALVINLLILISCWVLYSYDWNYIIVWIRTGTVHYPLQTAFAVLKVLLLVGITCYVYPILSRFQVNIPKAMLLSLSFCFRHFGVTLLAVVLLIMAVLFALAFPALCWVVPGIFVWLLSYPMEGVLRKYVPDTDQTNEDAWYLEK